MDFKSAEEYLLGFVSYENFAKIPYGEEAFNLKNLSLFLKAYGVKHEKLKIFHVGGSKGKGSVCALIERYLTASGRKVGIFTSPYMYSIRECFNVSGEVISENDFALLVNDLRLFLEENPHFELTYFELLTVLVLKYFLEMRVDYVVLEVGLGGRLDSTNVVRPIASIITRIEREHADILGPHLVNIIREKFGILKDGVPIYIGYQSRYVFSLMKRELGGRNFFAWRQNVSILEQNKGLVSKVLSDFFSDFDRELFNKVANGLVLPLRGEVRNFKEKAVVLDMAHTKESIKGLLAFLKNSFGDKKLVFLISILKGKQYKPILKLLSDAGVYFVFTASHPVRSLSPELLRKTCGKGLVVEDLGRAFEKAFEATKKDQVLVVTGSHFLTAEVSKIMQ